MDFVNRSLLRTATGLGAWRARVHSDGGQTLAEYGLLLTLVAVAVVVTSALLLRNELSGAFTAATNCFDGTC